MTASTPPIVGIGASAGGLEAFEQFFRACPADSGMAFVLVQHLDPVHDSLLTEILQHVTAMPVTQALDQLAVEPNHVYVIPPNREMTILHGVLQLAMPGRAHGQRMPIDVFLRSLAEDQVESAIGIILSGTATDGTLGMRAIFGAGGICLAQDPVTAKYDSMPQSVITAGYATHILAVDKMPAALLTFAQRSQLHPPMQPSAPEATLNDMKQILLQVRSDTGHDFSLYKRTTIGRRVQRRMAQNNIEDMAVYAQYLKANPGETQALFKELLINVTNFFRDPDSFVVLKKTILPALLADKPTDYVFRIWVVGCATGEEAYSIAIVLQEWLDEVKTAQQQELRAQIYATDLDDDAIKVARSGCYPPNIAHDVTPERLRRFFIKDDAGYKVKKEIREMVVFAVQNVIKDPPFTKLDLLSCRNVLIYLEPELQNRLIPTFHYALKPNGVLLLSTSESIANHVELFSVLDRKWKFYRANHGVEANYTKTSNGLGWAADHVSRNVSVAVLDKPKPGNVADLSNRALLQSYAPASVTTDLKGNILYVHGDTGKYLRPAPGPVTTNVVEMAHDGLQLGLRAALLEAATNAAPTLNQEVSIRASDRCPTASFSVRLLPAHAGETLLLVSFQDIRAAGKSTLAARRGKHRSATTAEAERLEQLTRELAYTKENLQATIEDQQATNEELKSTNEELQSTNEELQSANEELETSKEELQSLNEEIITVNTELNARCEQLNGIQNDMKNLFDNTNIGTLFLDHEQLIRRYTREVVKVYRLIASDVGRPLGDITSNIEGESLLAEIQSVLTTLIPCERELRTIDGAWYLARIQPYRTLDNVIEGVVLTFTEVTDFKLASEAVQRSETLLALAQEMAHLGSWELDIPQAKAGTAALATARMRWSDELFRIFGCPRIDTPMSLQDVLNLLSQEDSERVLAAIQASLYTQTPYDIAYRVMRPDGVSREVRSRMMAIADAKGRVTRLFGITLDTTEPMQAQVALREK
jgi:two-component system CheB/CheR fusion protein